MTATTTYTKNLTVPTQAGTRTFVWNLADQVTTTNEGSTTTSYGYDGDGNRLSQTTGGTTTNLQWDVNSPLPLLAVEQDGAGVDLRSYTYGLGPLSMDTPAGSFYFHRDGLGSITNLTDATGNTEWSYSYQPYGAAKTSVQNDPNAPANPIRFAGEYQDPGSGLVNLRARQYDQASGQFLTPDPIAYDPTASTYLYANANPEGLSETLCNWCGLSAGG